MNLFKSKRSLAAIAATMMLSLHSVAQEEAAAVETPAVESADVEALARCEEARKAMSLDKNNPLAKITCEQVVAGSKLRQPEMSDEEEGI